MSKSETPESAITRLRNLKISTKLAMLFIVLLIGFLAVGITYFSVLQVQQKANLKTDELLAYGALVTDVESRFSRVRSYEKRFSAEPE